MRFHHEVVDGEDHVARDARSACSYLVSRDYGPWIDEAFLGRLPVAADEPTRQLFDLLHERFAGMVAGATWLDDPTRQIAAAKVSRLTLRFVLDPDPGLDGLVLEPGSLLDAVWRMGARQSELRLAQIGTLGKRTFQMEHNAGGAYSLFANSVWLSSEYARDPWIQRRPFNAINFGSLGTLLGHEIGHALSIRGRPFDATGVKHETWSKQAVAAFEARTACLEAQLSSFDVGARWRVDAHQTLEEDLATLVGVRIALAAMEADAATTDIKARDNRRREFFLAFAQLRCGTNNGYPLHKSPDESHSPDGRILSGVLANVPEFAETFHCAPGTRMAPRERCAIW